ncbi:MAG: hypothetical protein ABEH81_01495 [Halopenitus sp.]
MNDLFRRWCNLNDIDYSAGDVRIEFDNGVIFVRKTAIRVLLGSYMALEGEPVDIRKNALVVDGTRYVGVKPKPGEWLVSTGNERIDIST